MGALIKRAISKGMRLSWLRSLIALRAIVLFSIELLMFILVYMKRFSTDLLKVHNPSLSIQSLFKQITAFVYLLIHLT